MSQWKLSTGSHLSLCGGTKNPLKYKIFSSLNIGDQCVFHDTIYKCVTKNTVKAQIKAWPPNYNYSTQLSTQSYNS